MEVRISDSALLEMERWKREEAKENSCFRLKAFPTGEC